MTGDNKSHQKMLHFSCSFDFLEVTVPHLKAERVANLVKIEVLKVALKMASIMSDCRQPMSFLFR